MDPKFIKFCQDKGWHIEAVTESAVVGKCPSAGCQMRAKLEQGGHVPAVDPGCRRPAADRKVASYDDVREILRERRTSLLLNIPEVEEIAGLANSHLAKAEKNSPTRIPNMQIMIEWAQALGYEFVLRPIELTPYAVRTICETRDKAAPRTKRFTLEQRRRGNR